MDTVTFPFSSQKFTRFIKFIAAIIVCQLTGILGALLTMDSVNTWYRTLEAPSFNPPSWVFGPVWTVLYLLMGISLFIIWNKPNIVGKRRAMQVFFVQLVLNGLWSPLFFGLKSPTLAFAEIVILWFTIIGTIILFWKISRPAAYLLVPYLLWVTFASILNFSFMVLN